jgi:hypothetical protein
MREGLHSYPCILPVDYAIDAAMIANHCPVLQTPLQQIARRHHPRGDVTLVVLASAITVRHKAPFFM